MLASLQGLQDQLRGGGTSFFNADAAGRFQQVQQALTIPLPAKVSDRGFPAFQEQDSLFGGAQVQVDPTCPRILQLCPGAQSYLPGETLLNRTNPALLACLSSTLRMCCVHVGDLWLPGPCLCGKIPAEHVT